MNTRAPAFLFVAALATALATTTTACSGSKISIKTGGPGEPSIKAEKLGSDTASTSDARCNPGVANHELSEYDTSGDGVIDVRKIFLRIGDSTTGRLVMICRESDINSDGRKDVVRYYDDEGRSLREESDRNFDGKMDQISVYQDGKIVRQELDDDFDGKVETKVFYDAGKPLRAERDLTGRSTDAQWKPDRWEYYEAGKVVRMGTDVDGDAKVDRWDRDAATKRELDVLPSTTAGQDG